MQFLERRENYAEIIAAENVFRWYANVYANHELYSYELYSGIT